MNLGNTRACHDSVMYACRAKHYDWTVPHPMWTVSAWNRVLSKDEIDKLLRIPWLCIQAADDKDELENESVFTHDSTNDSLHGRIGLNKDFLCQEHDAANWDVPNSDIEDFSIMEQSTRQMQQADAKQLCMEDGSHYSVGVDEYKRKYNELKLQYDRLLLKSESLRKQVFYYKTKYNTDVTGKFKEDNCITRKDALKFFITDMMKVEDIFMKVNRKPDSSRKNFRRDVARKIWNDEHEFCQVICNKFYDLSLQFIWQMIYSPANILKAMDLAGGILSMEAIKVLRAIEHQGQKWFKCLLPSPATIKKVSVQVEYSAS